MSVNTKNRKKKLSKYVLDFLINIKLQFSFFFFLKNHMEKELFKRRMT